MMPEDPQNDAVFAALSELARYDVDDIRAHRLRRRCRAALQRRDQGATAVGALNGRWKRALGPALVGAWCVFYVVETIRRAALVYGL